jgi:hypothetical protein
MKSYITNKEIIDSYSAFPKKAFFYSFKNQEIFQLFKTRLEVFLRFLEYVPIDFFVNEGNSKESFSVTPEDGKVRFQFENGHVFYYNPFQHKLSFSYDIELPLFEKRLQTLFRLTNELFETNTSFIEKLKAISYDLQSYSTSIEKLEFIQEKWNEDNIFHQSPPESLNSLFELLEIINDIHIPVPSENPIIWIAKIEIKDIKRVNAWDVIRNRMESEISTIDQVFDESKQINPVFSTEVTIQIGNLFLSPAYLIELLKLLQQESLSTKLFVDILRGISNRNLREMGITNQNLFGIFKDRKETEIIHFINSLEQRNWIEKKGSNWKLTETGEKITTTLSTPDSKGE